MESLFCQLQESLTQLHQNCFYANNCFLKGSLPQITAIECFRGKHKPRYQPLTLRRYFSWNSDGDHRCVILLFAISVSSISFVFSIQNIAAGLVGERAEGRRGRYICSNTGREVEVGKKERWKATHLASTGNIYRFQSPGCPGIL